MSTLEEICEIHAKIIAVKDEQIAVLQAQVESNRDTLTNALQSLDRIELIISQILDENTKLKAERDSLRALVRLLVSSTQS